MPQFETKYFGTVAFEEDAVLEFPAGLPAFEQRRRFLALRFPHTDPLVFLQSLEDHDLCFVALPALGVEPNYRLSPSADDLALIGLSAAAVTPIGPDLVCLIVVTVRETGPTGNLLAPILINPRSRQAVQAVQPDSGYSHAQELVPDAPAEKNESIPEAVPCS